MQLNSIIILLGYNDDIHLTDICLKLVNTIVVKWFFGKESFRQY